MKLRLMPRHKLNFEALGTKWEIVTGSVLAEQQKNELSSIVEDFDVTFSRFRQDSLVGKMAKQAGEYTFPQIAKPLFDFYEQLYALSEGAFSPLVGDALEDLGYDAEYSFKPEEIKRRPVEYDKVIKRQGVTITVSEPVVFDVGAAGKGYLVDSIGVWLEANGVSSYIIDASGDILHKGMPPEVVGLENPFKEGSVIGEVTLDNQALCGSSISRRAWGNGLHHIINPKTGLPTESIAATWVLAETTMLADGLATALFFCDPKVLRKQYNYEYVRVSSDASVEYSTYFANKLY